MAWLLPGEPPLNVDDIQGHTLIGFGAAAQHLGAFSARDLELAVDTVGAWARRGLVTSARSLLPRKGRPARSILQHRQLSGPWVMLAVSHRLLRAANLPSAFDDEWFVSDGGMPDIGALNDDPASDGGPVGGDWVIGGPGRPIDVLIVAAGGTPAAAKDVVNFFATKAEPWTAHIYDEPLSPIIGSKEHFGFRDGISQPALLGHVDGKPFELERRPDDGRVPYAIAGQPLLWPGDFIFGYPGTSHADARHPGPLIQPVDPASAVTARDGSFLVYRRLLQDVAAFRAFCDAETARLNAAGQFSGDAEVLAAHVVGRWKTGMPISGPSDGDPHDPTAVNGFSFYHDAMAEICPMSAHIRKVNPRIGSDTAVVPRILRRGAPFGPQYDPEQPEPVRGRGLTFLSYQTSITHQFGTLVANWMNSPAAPNGGGGHDPIVGQAPAGVERFFDLSHSNAAARVHPRRSRWVRMSGGGFLFVPSISVLEAFGRHQSLGRNRA